MEAALLIVSAIGVLAFSIPIMHVLVRLVVRSHPPIARFTSEPDIDN